AFPASVEVALDAQGGEPVGNHPDAPAGRVRRRVRCVPVGEQLGGRLVLVSPAEQARGVPTGAVRNGEVRRAPHALGGDDHPAAGDRVLAQLGQEPQALAMCCSRRARSSRVSSALGAGSAPARSSAASRYSSIVSKKVKRRDRRTSSGMSSRSFSFRRGRITLSTPARLAASTFSLMPPTGRTLPRSVISPVIAMSEGTGRFETSERSEVNIVTPADGPSFGIAPAGTWTWKSLRSKRCSSRPYKAVFALMYETAAWTDSFITSPRWPVTFKRPLPRILVDSTNRMSPPDCVQARPIATPERSVRSATSRKNLAGPRYSSIDSGVLMVFPSGFSSTTLRATFRQIYGTSRYRFRTPASLVYSAMMRAMAASWNSIWSGVSPCSAIWRGRRCRFEISILSSSE